MAATDSLQLKTMSAVQMWLGMLAPGGSPKGRLRESLVVCILIRFSHGVRYSVVTEVFC